MRLGHALFMVVAACAAALTPQFGAAATLSGTLGITVDADGSVGTIDSQALDIDNNGVDDFTFISRIITDPNNSRTDWAALVQPLGTNGVMSGGARLGIGTEISASESFTSGEARFVQTQFAPVSYTQGLWRQSNQPATSGYLGLAFDISGATHFGWLEVDVPAEAEFFANEITLVGFGYESTAGQAILAGETAAPIPLPATAWLLGGALGLLVLRSHRKGRA